MKQLQVPLLDTLHKTSPAEQISIMSNTLSRHEINIAPWPDFNYVPKVEFTIAHNDDCIFLKYYVEEAVIKAAYHKSDDPVYKDSCVEFFIAFDNEEAYYNIEFNAVGTCKLNFGMNRKDRIQISEHLIKLINFFSTIKNAENEIQWELSLTIPIEVFFQHELTSLSGQSCRANFYKCGDDLPTPHFLCWNNIDTPEPDFHVRSCFGRVQFL
jgi:hypothetical protein